MMSTTSIFRKALASSWVRSLGWVVGAMVIATSAAEIANAQMVPPRELRVRERVDVPQRVTFVLRDSLGRTGAVAWVRVQVGATDEIIVGVAGSALSPEVVAYAIRRARDLRAAVGGSSARHDLRILQSDVPGEQRVGDLDGARAIVERLRRAERSRDDRYGMVAIVRATVGRMPTGSP